MPKHLYKIPSGSPLPVDLTGLVDGSPFALDNGDGTHTLYALFGTTWEAIGSGGGGGATGLGDFALWKRTGVQDATSNTFDYAADLDSSSGTSITVDSGSPWTTAWGSAAPKVAAGVYTITLSQTKNAAFRTSVQLMDATGTALAWSPSAFSMGNFLELVGVDNGLGTYETTDSITVYLPADTHIDLGNAIGSDAGAQTNLLVQKVG